MPTTRKDTMRRLLALGAVTAGLAASAAPASAAPCPDMDGFDCGSITVPISRTAPSLGTTTVSYAVRPHDDQTRPTAGTTLVADGPGSPTIPNAGFLTYSALGDLTATHDLVLVDARGTGAHALDCPAFQHGTQPFSVAVPACAAQLGATRDYYTYGDLADDMDAVRAALALHRVDVYATGHATPVAEAYAVRHAAHLHSVVLDSPLAFTPWQNEDLSNAVNVVGLVCRRSPLCSAEIRHPKGELAWLAKRLRERPLSGVGYDADGAPHRVRLGEAELAFPLLFDRSGNQRTPAELPAAARALRAGDPVPLLRLAAENDFPAAPEPNDSGDPFTEDSTASGNAAICSEWTSPWDKAAARDVRLAQYRSARAALPRDFFAPFSLEAGLVQTPDPACLEWPAPARSNPILPPGAHYPDVPVLVVHGDLNTIRPQLQGARVAARFPHGRFVPIPQAGQSAAGWSDCARRIIQTFVATLNTGSTTCRPDDTQAVAGVGAFPRSAREYTPAESDRAGGDRSTRTDRQVAAAAVHTALDALYTQFDHASGTTGRGLRGGSYSVEFGDTGATFTLDGARLVDDVEVSGTFFFDFGSGVANARRLTVKGRGLSGGIELSDPIFDNAVPEMHVTGRIGGRRVALLVAIH